jgi:RHS repeat-associated protein
MGALRLTYNQREEALEKSSLFVVGALEVNGASDKNRVRTYRYGFQGQEEDQETGLVNYKYRMHDPRLGRFLSIDPLASDYPHNSPYAFSENRVIASVELEGLEARDLTHMDNNFDGATKAQIENHRTVTGYVGVGALTVMSVGLGTQAAYPHMLQETYAGFEGVKTLLMTSSKARDFVGLVSGVISTLSGADASGTNGAIGSAVWITAGEIGIAIGQNWDKIEKGTNEAIEDFTELGRMLHDAITPTPVTTGETYTAPTNPSDNTRVPTPLITPLKEEGIPKVTSPNQVSNDSQPQMSATPPERL